MKSNESEPGGVIIPIVTPMTAAGDVDTNALRRQVDRCVDAGVGGIFAGGSAGAGPMLRDHQWELMLETVFDATAGRVPVMAGIIATSTVRALDQIKISQRLGYGTIVVTPTFYIALERETEILAHFKACREATDQNLIIYNIPSCTGCQIPASVIRTMAEAHWAVAIKESSGDADYFRALMAIAAETGIKMLQGNETDIVWSLETGAAGIVPVCANYDPALFVNIYQSIVHGPDPDGTAHSAVGAPGNPQEQINALREILLVGQHNWISGITWGLHTLGIGSGIPPRPLQPADPQRKALIESLKTTPMTVNSTPAIQ